MRIFIGGSCWWQLKWCLHALSLMVWLHCHCWWFYVALAQTFGLRACLKNVEVSLGRTYLPESWANVLQMGPKSLMERVSVFALSTLVCVIAVNSGVENFWSCENCLVVPKIWIMFCEVWIFWKSFFVIQTLHASPAFGQCSWTLDKCVCNIATMHTLQSSNVGWHWMNACWQCVHHTNTGPVHLCHVDQHCTVQDAAWWMF